MSCTLSGSLSQRSLCFRSVCACVVSVSGCCHCGYSLLMFGSSSQWLLEGLGSGVAGAQLRDMSIDTPVDGMLGAV